MNNPDPNTAPTSRNFGARVSLGLILGAALGVLMQNVVLGSAIGLLLGALWGLLESRSSKKS